MVSSQRQLPKPRLLFLSQTLPYPPHGGVEARTYNVLRLLSRTFEITALCFYRRGGAVQSRIADSVAALSSFGEIRAYPIPQEWSRVRMVTDHLRSLFGRRVYTVHAYESDSFRSDVRSLLSEQRFDLVHLDSMDLSGYLPELGSLPVICVHHNVESSLLRRRATVLNSSLAQAYLRFQANLMEREERSITPRVALNVAVSRADADCFKRLSPTAQFDVVPNGVDVDLFGPYTGGVTSGVVFLGGSSWFPNLDGMQWFCESVLPILRERVPDVRVQWVGKATTTQRKTFSERFGVETTGYVTDITPFIHAASCFVVPLRFGGGTRLKILDAWAMGMPVVSTSVGCEGLDAVDGENILVRDGAHAFADGIATVLEDHSMRERLRGGARATAEKVYSWEVIGVHMTELYARAVAERSRRA